MEEGCDHVWSFCETSQVMYCSVCVEGCSIIDDLDMAISYINDFKEQRRTQRVNQRSLLSDALRHISGALMRTHTEPEMSPK